MSELPVKVFQWDVVKGTPEIGREFWKSSFIFSSALGWASRTERQNIKESPAKQKRCVVKKRSRQPTVSVGSGTPYALG